MDALKQEREKEMENLKSYTLAIGSTTKTVELHATGCRDLEHIKKAKRVVLSTGHAGIVRPAAFHEVTILAYPCCNPKRMAAAGRWNAAVLVTEAAEPVAEPVAVEEPIVEPELPALAEAV